MTDEQVKKHWPHVAALEEALGRLSDGATVPVRLTPERDDVRDSRTFTRHLRSQMYLANL